MKKLLKIVLSIVIIGLVFAICIITANIIDDSPHKNKAAYEQHLSNPALDDNIFVYLKGINAENENNIYSEGLKIISTGLEKLKAGNVTELSNSSTAPQLKGGEIEKLDCVLKYSSPDECKVSLAEINKKIADNKLLFSRLEKANTYAHYSEIFTTNTTYPPLLQANMVIAAKAILEAKNGNEEIAYQIWKNNFELNKKMMLGEHSSVSLAITLVNYSLSLNTLSALIHYRPEIASNKYAELSEIFTNIKLEDVKVQQLTMVEFAIPYHIIKNNGYRSGVFLENNSYNQYFNFYDDFISLKNSEPTKFFEAAKELRAKYKKDSTLSYLSLRNPIYKMVNSLMISSLVQSTELLGNIIQKQNKYKLIKAMIEIRKNNISPENIQHFLDQNKNEYFNLFNNDGFKFDEATKTIYTEFNIEEKGKVEVIKDEIFF